MADASGEKKENGSSETINCFSLTTQEDADVDTQTGFRAGVEGSSSSPRAKRGLKHPPDDMVQKMCRKIYGDISKLSYKNIHYTTYKRRIDSYLGKTLAKMSRAQLIKFGKMIVLKELKNKVQIKNMISTQAQLRQTLKAYKQTLWKRIRNSPKTKTSQSEPFNTETVNSRKELQVKVEADDLQIDVDLRAVSGSVLPEDPLSIFEFNEANTSNNGSQTSETEKYPDDTNSDSSTLSEQFCFTQPCQVVTKTSEIIPKQNNKEKDKFLNPRVVLTDINKLLEKKNKNLNIKRMFEKKWTSLNTEVSMKDNFFHQIQGITSLKMKLWQRYLKNSGNVYYYEKLKNPVLENVRATTEVTAPKDSLTGRCGYFEHCNRIYAFKLFYGRAIEETSLGTRSEWITKELDSKVKHNFEKQWTARIPGVAPNDNYFDRIQKLKSLKFNTCERYLKIDGKLYYFEKLQDPLQETVRDSTVTVPAKETLDGRCGYLRHGRNGLYLFKLIDENLTDDRITTVVNTSKVATSYTNGNVNQTKTSGNRDSGVSRTNHGKLKQQDIKPAALPCESLFDVFGTDGSEYVDVAFKNNGKRKYSDSEYSSSSLEDPEELCWEIPTTGGEVVRIKARKKRTNQIICDEVRSPNLSEFDLKSALYDWTPLSVHSPVNVLRNNANNVVLPLTHPRNANNVILPRKPPLHNVNNVISSREITHHRTNSDISPRYILPHNANNFFSPTKTSGTNVLKRVLIVKSRKSTLKDEFSNSFRNNVQNIVSASQNKNRTSDSDTAIKRVYSRSMTGNRLLVKGLPCPSVGKVSTIATGSIIKSVDKDVLVVPPLLEGPLCHSLVKVNKIGQQCIVKGRPLD